MKLSSTIPKVRPGRHVIMHCLKTRFLEEHDRCVGHFNLIFSGNKIGYELFLETDDAEQQFKYYKCTTNMVGTIFAASVGGACALAIISGAIGLYIFDKYLKRKEVLDHEAEGNFHNCQKIRIENRSSKKFA